METTAKRGRPTTGNAMSTAERKRKWRADTREHFLSRAGTETGMSVTALLELLPEFVENRKHDLVELICRELMARSKTQA